MGGLGRAPPPCGRRQLLLLLALSYASLVVLPITTTAFTPLLERKGVPRLGVWTSRPHIEPQPYSNAGEARRPLLFKGGGGGPRRRSSMASTPGLRPSAGVSVTLDRPAIPRFYGSQQATRVALVVAAALIILSILRSLPLGAVFGSIADAFKQFCYERNLSTYDKLVYRLRLLRGKLQSISDAFGRFWRKRFPIQVDVIQEKAYPIPCILEERTSLGGNFVKYRFQFPGASEAMDLDLGQQVSIIGSTPEERVVKASFTPLSERYTPGYFEIVAERNSVDDPSSRILDTLALGEGIQVTPGARLVNRHPGPINKLVLIVSKLGVVPALQFLKALLPPSPYSVDYANVVWVNEKQDQYILSDEMQELFYKYNSKIDVDTVAERDLFMSQLADNPIFRAAVPRATSDTLAVVAGPEFFVEKVIDYLRAEGYPEHIILVL